MANETDLAAEAQELRARLQEAEETVRAIRQGEVDALVVEGARGDQIYTLKGADHSYRIFLEAMHEGAATLTADGLILYCNRRFAEMARVPLEDVIGHPLRRFVRPADHPALETVLRDGFSGASKRELCFQAGGEPVPVYLTASALPLDDGGEPAICLVVTDLTEQKRSERLVADEKLARSIFEHASEAIVVCDTRERVLRASLTARRLCLCDPIGEIFSRAFPLQGEEPGEAPVIPFAEVFAGNVVQGIEAALTLEGPRGEETCELQVSAGPLRGPDDEVLGCVLTLTDVTARRHAELEMDRARREAEAANQAKDHFLATLSHELRTPLTPVLAVLSGLQENPQVPADVRPQLAMMRRNVELEARLIDDMLDLTRIARGKLELRREVADLRQAVDHALQTARGELFDKGLRLSLDLSEDDFSVWADTPRLTQVFWNLFSNAVKFTPPGGAIAVRAWRDEADGGPAVVVEVEDTGIGIEPDVLSGIFDAFQQGELAITRRFGGLGLGLAISKAIVELHGGSLSAASNGRGRGAKFSVRLPVGDLPAVQAERTRPAREVAPPHLAEEIPTLNILLVEDHEDTAEAMADLLREMGHQVTVAGSVADGLAAAASQDGRIDLVLSDLGLPDGTGLDLMAELHGRYGVKGIALSGYGMEEDVRKSLEAGFDRHLTKPVNLRALQTAIQDAARG
ncbi:MAG TPA: ATP-binding protein [Thermoanaerobaculia bacterium]|nr:ATP-binding protein [Thermoanaerobaculia bacterium]